MVADVTREINYFTSSTNGCPPWLVTFSIPTTVRSNFVQEPVPVTVQDLRRQREEWQSRHECPQSSQIHWLYTRRI
jgi:hypothetical protein